MTTLRSLVSTLSIAICLAASWPCTAKESVSQDDLSAQKEFLQAKLDASKELQQKDLEVLHKRIDALDKRLDDQVSRVSDIGSAVDRFGILVTVLLAAAGLAGYVSVVDKSRREAKGTSETWFEQNSEKLRREIDKLVQKASLAHGDIDESVNNVKIHGDQAIALAKEASERVQKNLAAQTDLNPTPISPADAKILKQGSDALKEQPESHYSYNDWNTRAFTAISENKLEDAAYYFGKAYDASTQAQQAASTLYNKGVALGQLGRNQEAVDTYEALIARLGDDPAPAIREQVIKAMFNKAVRLGQIGDNDKAIATYEQVIDTYSSDPAPALREQVAKAMVNKGVTHGQMGDNDKEIAAYEQVIDTYSSDPAPALREQVAKAMVNKGVTHGKMGDNDKEIATYEQVIDTFSSDPAPALREQVAKAMFNKGVTHGQMGDNNKEIAAYEQVIDTYSSDPALREKVAQAMVNKGVTHGKMGNNDKEIATYEQVIDTYSSDPAPALREQVARALNGKGFTLLLTAKEQLVKGDDPQANKLLQKGETDLLAAVERKPQWGMALGNLAYIQWLLKRPAESEATFRTALTANNDGGEDLYKGTLDDIAQHPIPEDTAFREMVVRLWTEFQALKPSES